MRARLALGIAAAVLVAVAASCSLGLDESLIGAPDDGGVCDGAVSDVGPVDGGTDAPVVTVPDGGTCASDDECETTHGCLGAKCDLSRWACVFPVCRPAACSAAACDTSTRTCGDAGAYGYRAAQFPVAGAIGCGGALGRCFAAVHPFLFVGTTNGVLAYDVSDPRSTSPRAVPITGLGFLPAQIVTSGSRVFFLGTPFGAAEAARVPLAYVDVPPTPFVDAIPVANVLPSWNRPGAEPVLLLPGEGDTALLIGLNAAASYPSGRVVPPLIEPLEITATPIPFPAGSGPVASSGGRLVMNRTVTGTPFFAFVDGAGSTTPQAGAEMTPEGAAPVAASQAFGQSGGAVFWSVAELNVPPDSPLPVVIDAARGYFLVPDGNAGFVASASVLLESYPGDAVGPGAAVAGPVAMLDGQTALVTTAAPANLGQTNVRFVRRQPLDLVRNGDDQPRSDLLALAVGQLAAAGSNGIGYVLAVDPGAPSTPTVYTYDPACAP
jgi:hypothetical protein